MELVKEKILCSVNCLMNHVREEKWTIAIADAWRIIEQLERAEDMADLFEDSEVRK